MANKFPPEKLQKVPFQPSGVPDPDAPWSFAAAWAGISPWNIVLQEEKVTANASTILSPLRGVLLTSRELIQWENSAVPLNAQRMRQELGQASTVFALYCASLKRGSASTDTPPVINLEIRLGSRGAVSQVFLGTYTPVSWEDEDFVLQISGRMYTQAEIWMNVDPAQGANGKALAGIVFHAHGQSGGAHTINIDKGPNTA